MPKKIPKISRKKEKMPLKNLSLLKNSNFVTCVRIAVLVHLGTYSLKIAALPARVTKVNLIRKFKQAKSGMVE